MTYKIILVIEAMTGPNYILTFCFCIFVNSNEEIVKILVRINDSDLIQTTSSSYVYGRNYVQIKWKN